MRDLRAIGRNLLHRQTPGQVWTLPAESKGDVEDFLPQGDGCLVVREGGLGRWDGRELRTLEANQGVLRLFPGEAGRVWVAGTYHRVLAWDEAHGLRHAISVRGPVRGVEARGDRLVVGFEEGPSGRGIVRAFRRVAWSGAFEPEGPEIDVGMDRWSAFAVSPEGERMLANLPNGPGVGVWRLEDGARLSTWPNERLARVLAFDGQERVVFDLGPKLTIQDGAYGHEANRLVRAKITGGAPEVLVQGFAAVLSAAKGLDPRLAFSDMEGLVRVAELDRQPPTIQVFALKPRGIPWRLRFDGPSLWVHRKGEPGQLERYPDATSKQLFDSAIPTTGR